MRLKFNSLISHPSFLFLLALLNGAMVMNFDFVIWEHPLFLLAVLFFALNLIDYRFWWTTLLILPISLFQLLYSFPRMANHCNLLLFMELFILGILAYKIFHPKFSFSTSLMNQLFRVVVFTTYFFAGFNKLNTDFFNPCTSCVNLFHNLFMANFTGTEYETSKNLSIFFQYLIIAVELIVPFGIFFPRTRKVTALILFGFHFYLSLINFFNFSAVMVFLILGTVIPLTNQSLNPKIIKGLKIYLLTGLLAVICNSIFKDQEINPNTARFMVGILHNLGLLFLLVPIFKIHQPHNTSSLNLKEILALSITGLFLSFWGLKSFIGLGNSGNLTMFSNLITEQSRSNHYLVDTKKTKLVYWEEDYVEILKLNDSLKNQYLEGYNIPTTEFKYLTHSWVQQVAYPLNATVVYQKDTLTISDLRNSKFNQVQWWYKYVPFRKTKPQGSQPCLW